MDKIAVYIHGKDGNVNEAEHYKPLFPQYDVKGFDYKAQTPWEAKKEFPSAIRSLCKEYESVTLIANSIGGVLRAAFVSRTADRKSISDFPDC